MIKLVVSDMDGTLLAENSVLDGKAFSMIKKLREQGICFTVATGRSRCLSEEYERVLGLEIPYIACNGAVVLRQGKVIRRYRIGLAGLRPLVERADRMGMSVVFSIDGEEYYYRETPWICESREKKGFYKNPMVLSEAIWRETTAEKVMIMDGFRSGRIALMEEMCGELPMEYGYTRYTDMSVEIVNRKATKANGVKFLAEYLGITMEEVLAVGDHKNDCEMLETAGMGAAVANAIPDAKKSARYVCGKDHLEGVMEAVEHFCGINMEEIQ